MLCEYGCGQEAKYQFKNEKWCCSKNHSFCPSVRKKNSLIKFLHPERNPVYIKINCQYCNKKVSCSGIKLHENFCYLNPTNLKLCPICKNPVKNYRGSTTCSRKCGMIHFEEDIYKYTRKPSEKKKSVERDPNYRKICFETHGKKCIICGENKIVTVHHFDGDHSSVKEEDLIPLCPTHHIYYHSKFRYLIEQQIEEYRKFFILDRMTVAVV